MNLKQILQNLFKIQTKDNNFSKKNKKENIFLTEEFKKHNEAMSKEILRDFIIKSVYKHEGVTLPDLMVKELACSVYLRYKSFGFIVKELGKC